MHILKGFQRRGHVPVNFPQDICMFRINEKKFAAGLTYGRVNATETNKKRIGTLKVFIREDENFRQIHEYQSEYLAGFDCDATSDAGFIAVANTIPDIKVKDAESLLHVGSFVLRVFLEPSGEPKLELFQKFAVPNQNGVRLWARGQRIYLVFSYNTGPSSPLTICTIYKMSAMHFDPIDDLPCQNARVIEFFTVHHNLMVFIGNYRENNGTTNTFSSIMRYELNQQRFVLHQKIFTNAITVGRYFFRDQHEQRQHYLFIGNSFEISEFGVINYDVPSIIYKVVNGFFIPMQTINVKQVQAVLPINVSRNV